MLPKACKNATELRGTAAAHRRDGAAIVRFLHWLDTEAQSGKVTEIDAALKLLNFRTMDPSMKDMSFETISGAGPNGALPHYRVSSASNRVLERGTLYLVDSGGQYLDGTTDITRTVAIGDPSTDMKRHNTLVLKGHIAMDRVRFPEGTTGLISIRWHGTPCGRPGLITITAPAMASASILACTKARRESPKPGMRHR